MPKAQIVSVKRKPGCEEDGFPAFLVEGAFDGKPFVYEVAVEIDGREADWSHVSGEDFESSEGSDSDVFIDFIADACEAIYKTPEYKALVS